MNRRALLSFVFLILASLALEAQAWKFDRFVNTPYPQPNSVTAGDMEVADFTGDGLADIVLAGTYRSKAGIFFYKQEKTAFTILDGHGLPGLLAGALVASADFDGDGDTDIALMGKTGAPNETALIRVYLNDGSGHFSPGADLGGQLPSEDFEDKAGSWGPDDKGVLGATNANGWSQGLFEAADLNGDRRPDLVFAGAKGLEGGTDPSGQMIQREWETGGVFLNQGNGQFRLVAKAAPDPDFCGAGFRKVNRGAGVLADFDQDGVLDLALFGQANLGPLANPGIPETQRNGLPVGEIWKGTGDGSFVAFGPCGITPCIDGAVQAADVNGDGKTDLVLMGNTGHPKDPAGGRLLEVWLGKGDGSFAKDPAAHRLIPLMSGGLALGDLDGDGDSDLVASGNDNTRSLYVYENQGGVFVPKALGKARDGIGANAPNGSAESDASQMTDLRLLDMDRDGDLDLFLSGTGGVDQLLVFRNRLK